MSRRLRDSFLLQSGAVILAFALHFYWAELLNRGSAAIIFSNLMTILSISFGFFSSFYFFLGSRPTRFISALEGTNTFARLMRFARNSVLVAVCSIFIVFLVSPLSDPVGNSNIDGGLAIGSLVLYGLAFSRDILYFVAFYLSSLTLLGFFRCGYFFYLLTRP